MKKALTLAAALTLARPSYAVEPLVENPGYSNVQMKVRSVIAQLSTRSCSRYLGMRKLPQVVLHGEYDRNSHQGFFVLNANRFERFPERMMIAYNFTTDANHVPTFLQISRWQTDDPKSVPNLGELFPLDVSDPIYTKKGRYGKSVDGVKGLVVAMVDYGSNGMFETEKSFDLVFDHDLLMSQTWGDYSIVKKDIQKAQQKMVRILADAAKTECGYMRQEKRKIRNTAADIFRIRKSLEGGK